MFWQEFEEKVGEIGADPVSFYSYRIGHTLHVTPEQTGELTPGDILGGLMVFDAMYGAADG